MNQETKTFRYPFSSSKNSLSILKWAQNQSVFCLLDSNHFNLQRENKQKGYSKILAVREKTVYDNLGLFSRYIHGSRNSWFITFLNYNLKNNFEDLHTQKKEEIPFPNFYAFEPEYLFIWEESDVFLISPIELRKEHIENLQKEIIESIHPSSDQNVSNVTFKPITSKENFSQTVEKLQNHIQQGDVYELNYCQTFLLENFRIDPLELFLIINSKTKTPFTVLFKYHKKWVLSFSPERFLKKENQKLISQPIKGTRPRGKNKEQDLKLKLELKQSSKDKSENVMIVDLVRNDLSRIASRGSVKVDELFKVYSYEGVHQLISTISAEINNNITFEEIIRATFPMGSMTGAPKLKAMMLIDEYEDTSRGVFSGSIGYINPLGDFDFNVLIRTLIYDQETQKMILPVGGAITIESNPEEEYQECLDKIQLIKDIIERK